MAKPRWLGSRPQSTAVPDPPPQQDTRSTVPESSPAPQTAEPAVAVEPVEPVEPVAVATPASAPDPTPAPAPAPTPAPTPRRTIPVIDDALLSRLKTLTPEQRQALRSGGVAGNRIASGCVKNPDGSVTATITLDADIVPQLEAWADEAGKTLHEQIQEQAVMLFSSYLNTPMAPLEDVVMTAGGPVPYADWVKSQELAAAPPATPPATPPPAVPVAAKS